jgi:PTH1 family peptidyl-tRNA hydrolase
LKIVVGLGNPDEKYRGTRHNLGFHAVEEFCRRIGIAWSGRECLSQIARGRLGAIEILVAKPETYMNASGEAVTCLANRYGVAPEDLLVVCDDAAIDLGAIRLRASGSDAGHRGMRSILESMATENIPRLRIGIRTAETSRQDLAEHVLSSFATHERGRAEEQARRAAECIQTVLEEGMLSAMNRYNRRQTRDPEDSETNPK